MECDICVKTIDDDEFFECDGCIKKFHIKCDKINKKDVNARKASGRLKLLCAKCVKKPNEIINENLTTMMKFIQKIDLTTQTYDAKQSQIFYDMERMKDKVENMFKSLNEMKEMRSNVKLTYSSILQSVPKIPIVVKPKEKTQNSNKTKDDIKNSVNLKDVKANGAYIKYVRVVLL